MEKNQLETWGWDPKWESKLSADSELEPGRVIGQGRNKWSIQVASGAARARLISAKKLETVPVVGDWVLVEPGPTPSDPWTIHGLLPRRTQLSRGAAGKHESEQTLAANIDWIWILHGLDIPVNLRKLERYLAVAWQSGAVPVIILTKADLVDDPTISIQDVRNSAPGVDVHVTGFDFDEALEILYDSLSGGATVCLMGPSGVGKSTLVNRLAGEEIAEVGEVREGDRKGRHTTTRRQLFKLKRGGCLLDTPGIRELKIWSLNEGLDSTFPDIEEIADTCKFRDCKHESEPGCAVTAAVEQGRLPEERLQSFRKLQAEARAEERRRDPGARAAAVSEWKAIMKSMKQHSKHKNRS